MTIWRMRIACSIAKAKHAHTHTHTEYVILIALPLQQWVHERASMLRHAYIACIVVYFKQTWAKTHVDLLTEAHLVHNYSWKFEDAFTTPIMEMTVTICSHSKVSMCSCRNSADMRHVSQVAAASSCQSVAPHV